MIQKNKNPRKSWFNTEKHSILTHTFIFTQINLFLKVFRISTAVLATGDWLWGFPSQHLLSHVKARKMFITFCVGHLASNYFFITDQQAHPAKINVNPTKLMADVG